MAATMLLLDLMVVAIVGLLIYWLADRKQRKGKHLPPGPNGLPFLGNALQIPRGKEHLVFVEMGNLIGKFYSTAVTVPALIR